MVLKIKEGSEIWAYGKGAMSFTDKSELSQDILKHLQERFPDHIEEIKESKEEKKSKKEN